MLENLRSVYTKAAQILSNFIYILFMCFVIVSILSFGLSKVKGEEPTVMGFKPIYILSGSMESNDDDKTIKKDSVIISRTVDADDVSIGDVITFDISGYGFPEGTQVTHRVVDIEGGKFLSKGDGNKVNDFFDDNSEDGYLPLEVIKYRLVMRNNWVSTVVNVYRQKPMVFALYSVSALSAMTLLYLGGKFLYDEKYELKLRKKD